MKNMVVVGESENDGSLPNVSTVMCCVGGNEIYMRRTCTETQMAKKFNSVR